MSPRQQGFTLIEAVTALAVLALLAGLALPSLSPLLEQQRARAAAQSLLTPMWLARSAAITHRRPVILCPTADGTHCDRGGNWNQGWMVFIDHHGDRQPASSQAILRQEQRRPSDRLLVAGTRGRTHLRYMPDGRSAGTNLTLDVCTRQGVRLARVVVSNAGRPRSERGGPSAPCVLAASSP